MGRLVRVYVAEKIGDAVDALRKAGLKIDYRPVETDPSRSGSLPRNSGTVYNAAEIRENSPDLMVGVPENAMTGFEVIDDCSLCPFLLRKIWEELTVMKWPDGYDADLLPQTEPIPTMKDVLAFASHVNFRIQLFGATAEAQNTFLHRMRELGRLIAGDFGVTLEGTAHIPPTYMLSTDAAEMFLILEAWVSDGCPQEK